MPLGNIKSDNHQGISICLLLYPYLRRIAVHIGNPNNKRKKMYKIIEALK